jgi:VanZ family protein
MPKKVFLYWLPVIAYAFLIFLFSSFSHVALPENLQFRFWDKFAHASEYTVFGFLLFRTLKSVEWKHPIIWAWGLGTIYGISDEIHQMFVPGRLCQVWDGIADSVGILLGVLIFRWFRDRAHIPHPF